ncbi:hypothetical protein A8L34_06855 [Bacillus sp. FJAT-27264]|uniref:hypothetical protein n=1 Tax=Paenibacillus sp. (strain DSM 101736 / FJAT-27264) TaxID=1850362 RepID=UPI0008080948|nr:hypothetical protein [Bacillus sp. FJAT-27264]OBZ19234.1 hypothetical protein A8L34_06855 [Bacillus sp. FJAT-27264]
MARRIQAYFKTEDDALGAKTALIAYNVEGLEVWPLNDRLGQDSRFLLPVIPLGNSALAAGGFSTSGTSGAPGAGAALVASTGIPESVEDVESRGIEGNTGEEGELSDEELGELRYIMELKVDEDRYNEVIQILRGKQAYVERFD